MDLLERMAFWDCYCSSVSHYNTHPPFTYLQTSMENTISGIVVFIALLLTFELYTNSASSNYFVNFLISSWLHCFFTIFLVSLSPKATKAILIECHITLNISDFFVILNSFHPCQTSVYPPPILLN